MTGLAHILRTVREERCQLRHFWELGEHLPGREQAKLAQALGRIVPATVERDGRRVRCEPPAKDRRRLVLAMLADGASRSEILSVSEDLPGCHHRVDGHEVPGLSERTVCQIAAESRTARRETPPTNRIPERRLRQKREDLVAAPTPEATEPERDEDQLADLPNCTDHCSTCEGHFSSLEALDAHRVGPWSARRCGASQGLVKITEEAVCQICDPDKPKVDVALYGLRDHDQQVDLEGKEAVLL